MIGATAAVVLSVVILVFDYNAWSEKKAQEERENYRSTQIERGINNGQSNTIHK